MLGNTAPDVQTISGQERQVTHFFDLPILSGMQTAWHRMLALYPYLARPAGLSPAHAAFLAGYLCHLQADWLWVVEIFSPVFGPACSWDTFHKRLYLHNVLRAHLDQQILNTLDVSAGEYLSRVNPTGWLPFVEDGFLGQWRDWLAQQLHPGSKVQTVEVFAARQGVSPEEYYQLLNSEEKLDAEIFARLPRQNLDTYRSRLVKENLRLLQTYLNGGESF